MASSSPEQSPADESPAAVPAGADEAAPTRAVFRMPLIAVILLPLLAAFCLGPIATVNVWWTLLFVVPVLIGVAVLLTRTEVDDQAITVRGLRPTRRLPWGELDRLEFSGPRWAVAVGMDEQRLRLPMVRPRDLPVLAAVSGGYLTFTAPRAEESEEFDDEQTSSGEESGPGPDGSAPGQAGDADPGRTAATPPPSGGPAA